MGAAVLLVAALAAVAVANASASSTEKGTISVLFSNNYVFDTDAQATAWWNSLQKQFDAQNPGSSLKQLGVGGTDIDEMNKAALLFRSPSTTPDVIQLPTTYTSQFASSGYLLPLTSYVSSASSAPFWAGIPKNVQQMGDYNGTLYAVNNGNNDFGVFYNKVMFKEAGLPTNWAPKNWADILSAAEAIHAKLPKVGALWLAAGVAAGPTNILQGIGNLIVGSKEPTMFDTKTGSYVVGPGLSDSLNFYKEVYSKGLGAPVSQLFAPNAVGNPPQLFAEGKLAIAIAGAVCFGAGFLFGLPALRLGGLYLALATFALAVATPQLLKFKAFDAYTGGVQGLLLAKPKAPLGMPLTRDQWLYFVCVACAIPLFWAAANLVNSRIGRALVAIRDHPIAAETMGVDAALYKTTTFGLSAAYTGVAGALMSLIVGFVSPDSFGLFLSLSLVVGIVVGGLASIPGVVVGALFIEFTPNVADRISDVLGEGAKAIPWAIYGVLLILIMYAAPSGAAGAAKKLAQAVERRRSGR